MRSLYRLLSLINDIMSIFGGRAGQRIINKKIGKTMNRFWR